MQGDQLAQFEIWLAHGDTQRFGLVAAAHHTAVVVAEHHHRQARAGPAGTGVRS